MGNNEASSETADRRTTWRRLKRWIAATALILLVYSLAGFVLAPLLLKRSLPRYAAEQLGHQLDLGQVRINPFLFTLESNDFQLKDDRNEPLLSYTRLHVDFELKSIVLWTWTFADILIEGPTLNLVIDGTNRLNLAKLLARMSADGESAAPEATGEGQLVRLRINRFSLHEGACRLDDRSGTRPVTTVLTPVTLEVNELSTLADEKGTFGISALLPEGGRLTWQGELTPNPLISRGSLNIEGFQPAIIWDFFQERLNLARPEGLARLAFAYQLDYSQGKLNLLIHPLVFGLENLVLRAKDQEEPLLQLTSVEAAEGRFDLAGRELHLPSVTLRRGRLSAETAQDGRLDWQRLFLPPGTTKPQGAGEAAADAVAGGTTPPDRSPPWRLRVDTFSLAELAVRYQDQSRGAPFDLAVDDLTLNLTAEAEAGANPALRLSSLAFHLKGISSREPEGAAPLWSLAEARLTDGDLDLVDRLIRLDSLILTGGEARVLRSEAGNIRQVEVYAPKAPEPDPTDEPAAGGASPDWRVQLTRLELAGFGLGYVDQAFQPVLEYDLHDLSLVAEGLDTAGTDPIAVSARTLLAQGGVIEGEGALALNGEAGNGRIRLEGVNLRPLQSLLGRYLRLHLVSGQASLDSRLHYLAKSASEAGPTLKVEGQVGIQDLLLEEADGGRRFLSWREVSARGIDFNLSPASLTIAEIKVDHPETKIEIFADGKTNLAGIVRERPAPPSVATEAATAELPEAKPFSMKVERVRLDNGVVDFSDLSVILPFYARIEKVAGTVLNISSDPAARATLKFSGQVDQYGQAEAGGTLAPLDPKRFVDLQVNFRNVELVPVSPYTATFAGRRIADGRLDMDLNYKIENSDLLGDHRVTLRNFSLGERVENPDALSLPLDLAVALLTDQEGKIDVAVPVRGNLDNPEFSYGHVVWQAVRNLLTKIVTAPFKALGSLFDSGADQPDRILFRPGQVELAPPEREKLAQVAKVLNQRPQLILTVHGTFARALDGRSLRDLAVRRSLAALLDTSLQPGEDPGPVAFDHAKTQRALEELAGGNGPVAEFQATYEATAGVRAQRVNPALALFGKGSEDHAFYRALFEHLVDNEALVEEELRNLAAARSTAVIRELTEAAGLAPERLQAGRLDEAEPVDQSVATVLELGVGNGGNK